MGFGLTSLPRRTTKESTKNIKGVGKTAGAAKEIFKIDIAAGGVVRGKGIA